MTGEHHQMHLMCMCFYAYKMNPTAEVFNAELVIIILCQEARPGIQKCIVMSLQDNIDLITTLVLCIINICVICIFLIICTSPIPLLQHAHQICMASNISVSQKPLSISSIAARFTRRIPPMA